MRELHRGLDMNIIIGYAWEAFKAALFAKELLVVQYSGIFTGCLSFGYVIRYQIWPGFVQYIKSHDAHHEEYAWYYHRLSATSGIHSLGNHRTSRVT